MSLSASAPRAMTGSLADAARVARFVRGALAFRARPSDVFISSYPRSGTTWLQYTLHLLVNDGDSGFSHISEVVPWYERSLALGHQRAEDFERMPSPRIFKSHLPYAWLPRGARYVYAQRDGRDVAVSYHQLYRSHLGSNDDFDTFFERFMRGSLQYGSWFDHVASWRAQADNAAIRIVDYEALDRDLEQQMRALCAFVGCARTPARVTELARACSFEAMKRDEPRFDHATQRLAPPTLPAGAFLRKGTCGAHRTHFNPQQNARFEAALHKERRGPSLLELPAFLH